MPDNEREDTIGLVDEIDDFEAELRQMMSRRLSDRPGPLIVLTPGHTVAGKYRLKERLGSGGNHIGSLSHKRAKPAKNLQLMRQRTIRRAGHIAFHFRKFSGGETYRLRRRLAMNEYCAIHQFMRMRRTHINMISQNIIMFDFQ